MRNSKLVLMGAAAVTSLLVACLDPTRPAPNGPLTGDWVAMCGVDVACVMHLEERDGQLSGTFGLHVAPRNLGSDYPLSGSHDSTSVHVSWREPNGVRALDGTVSGDSLIRFPASGSVSAQFIEFRKPFIQSLRS